MNEAIKVLDHGIVRLVESMGSDLSIVRNARVSYDAEWRAGEDEGSDSRLVNYLMKNHHTTPFESVVFTFEVKAPIFVLRRWQRHRTWSYNELGAHCRELPEEYYLPTLEQIITQSTCNKRRKDTFKETEKYIQEILINQNKWSYTSYQRLLGIECPRELARSVLPLCTYSHMFCTVDLHNLFHFLRLSLHEHAQYEIRVYAQALLELIEPIVPVAVKAFRKHVLEAPTVDELQRTIRQLEEQLAVEHPNHA